LSIYENDYNFLFGWAQKKWGVISYARFLLGDPTPTDEQFEKRAIIQFLSSIGFVIGIPRPTNPNCARAYPNSPAEMGFDIRYVDTHMMPERYIPGLDKALRDWAAARGPLDHMYYYKLPPGFEILKTHQERLVPLLRSLPPGGIFFP
jgi:hypothetical protein